MALRYVTKKVVDLTESEYAQCMKATFCGEGRYGRMQPELQRQRFRVGSNGRAYMCFKGTKLAGWALGFEECGKWSIYVYVYTHNRRKGIGKVLLARARMGRKDPIVVFPWNAQAEHFYTSVIQSGRAIGAS